MRCDISMAIDGVLLYIQTVIYIKLWGWGKPSLVDDLYLT